MLTSEGLHFQHASIHVKLYPARPSYDQIVPAPTALAPSRFCLYEWTDYRLRIDGAKPLQVSLDTEILTLDQDGFYPVRYANQLGRSHLLIRLAPSASPQFLRIPIEILSPRKYRDPAQYLTFYQALLADLYRLAAQLPFSISAPVHMTAAESTALASPLFAYYFFLHHGSALRAALEMILADPHRLLAEESQWLRLSQVNHVTPEVLLGILTHPELLTPAPAHLLGQLSGRRRRPGNPAPDPRS